MQPANLINSLQTLIRTAKPLIVADQPAKPPASPATPVAKLEAGQQVQATIQEQVSPGLFKVQVAGQSIQMQLPGSPKVGNVLTLKVESASPRLTFSFFASSTPIATQEQISSTSRLLSNLTDLPLGRTLIESAAGHPVWPTSGTAPDSHELATALKDALANSGLFYESHQAQWVRGERSTAQLLIEPQNQLEKQTEKQLPSSPPDNQLIKAESGSPIAKELVPLVQQQLHTLETHQLTWSGSVWPGQQMQWEIQGQPEQDAALPDERQWSTEMELALPRLGDVHARLVFSQGEVTLTLQAADADSVALFNRHLSNLGMTLAEAGIPLNSSVVEKI